MRGDRCQTAGGVAWAAPSDRSEDSRPQRVALWGAAPPEGRAPRMRRDPSTTDSRQETRPGGGGGPQQRQDPRLSAGPSEVRALAAVESAPVRSKITVVGAGNVGA